MHMISTSEVNFISDLLSELLALTDPSEYLQDEVDQALELLAALKQHSAENVLVKADVN